MEVKKILIMTLYGDYNYGNKFQNYAMQFVLNKFSLDVYTNTNLDLYFQKKIDSQQKSNKIIKVWKKLKEITFLKIINRVKYELKKIIEKKRLKVFKKFSDNYLKTKNCKVDDKLNEEFDMMCIGSDQIWNPHFADNFYYTYGKSFDKVLAYAPSYGIEKIPPEYKEPIKKGLEHIKYISVREEKGADIVEELTGKRPEVLVDPTLLLSDKEWDKILKMPKKCPKGKYILTYFLGEYSKERKEYINNFARDNNLKVVNLAQIKDKKYYYTGPSEFLYFVKNCEIFFTDSFHGSVFSILYKKPFYVMNREDNIQSMNSRIETLLKKFELQDREIINYRQEINLDCNFSSIDKILDAEREKSMEFLKKSIGMGEKNNEDKSN